jgi:hypothetical protein
VKCKDFYWHLINIKKHNPTSKHKWSQIYKSLENPEEEVWNNIYKMPFQTIRDTKIQTIQYRIIHRIIPCNEWLFNIKINESKLCNFCEDIDDIPHFFIKCTKNKPFWKTWSTWWNNITDTDLSSCYNAEECILFGFKGGDDLITILNYSILIAKQYIYHQRLSKNNNIEFLTYLQILKKKLHIENIICEKQDRIDKFDKFKVLYDNL